MSKIVAHTSKEAYASLQDTIGEAQYMVFTALGELGVADNNGIAYQLGWTINRVTGRVNELRKMGYVELAHIRKNEFGRNVKVWRVKEPTEDTQTSLLDGAFDCE